jgi:hypothetical protein
MRLFIRTIVLTAVLLLFSQFELFSQPTITFNINLEPQLKDSVFIPGRDRILVTGNTFPLTQSSNILKDSSTPPDSIYSITLRFSNNDFGKTLNYKYIMYINGQRKEESLDRQVRVRREEMDLDALYFDSYAW